MSVILIVAKTADGAESADVLQGGSVGLDKGQVIAGSYTPIMNQASNTGRLDIYVRGTNVVDPIQGLTLFVDTYSGVYGGANSAAADLATMLALGAADTGTTNNNTDFGGGLSRGLHMDMSWDVPDTNQFSYVREGSGQMRIFGKSYAGKDGATLATGFLMHQDANSYWNGTTELDATAPVAGDIGIASDAALGNRAHFRMRFYIHQGASDGGYLQNDDVYAFSYSA